MMRFVCHESRYNTYRMADRALSIVRNSKSLVRQNKAYVTYMRTIDVCWV